MRNNLTFLGLIKNGKQFILSNKIIFDHRNTNVDSDKHFHFTITRVWFWIFLLFLACILGAINLHSDTHYVFHFVLSMHYYGCLKLNLRLNSICHGDLTIILVHSLGGQTCAYILGATNILRSTLKTSSTDKVWCIVFINP